jgi:hypothetical protein
VIGHHVVEEVRVDRRARRAAAGLDIRQEAQQGPQVVALGEALALHQAFALENDVGIEKAASGDEIDLRNIRPARQQRPEEARRGRLAHRDRARQADDVIPTLTMSDRRLPNRGERWT